MRLFQVLAAGGYTMIPLVACSVLVVAIIVWRCIANRIARLPWEAFLREVREEIETHGWEVALSVCRRTPQPLGRVFSAGILHRERSSQALSETLEDVALREGQGLTWGLTTLGSIATIAPFIGLLGTVIGVLRAFWDIGEQGKTGSAVVASGVAEALIATAAGLLVGIVAVLGYNILVAWHERFVQDLQLAGAEMARTVSSIAPGRSRSGTTGGVTP